MTNSEPRNPLYLLLLLAGLLFAVTALAYAVVPVLEQKAADAGQPPPPSPFRDALRKDGWRWILYEVGAVVVLSVASMALDRLRSLQNKRANVTIPREKQEKPSPQPGVPCRPSHNAPPSCDASSTTTTTSITSKTSPISPTRNSTSS